MLHGWEMGFFLDRTAAEIPMPDIAEGEMGLNVRIVCYSVFVRNALLFYQCAVLAENPELFAINKSLGIFC